MADERKDTDPEEELLRRAGRRRRIRRRLWTGIAGVGLLAVDALYVTYGATADGIIDIRESFLGVGMLAAGALLACRPLLGLAAAILRACGAVASDRLIRPLVARLRRGRGRR